MTRHSISASLLFIGCSLSNAQEIIKYPSTNPSGNAVEAVATIRLPKQPLASGRRFPAVVLLHTKGGWSNSVTEQYAKALNDSGVATLEPRLFENAASAPTVGTTILPMVYDALKYLSDRPDVDGKRIGLAGFSSGGAVALHAAAAWAQAGHAKTPDLKFAAHAPFYPSCSLFSAFAQGQRKTPGIPTDALTKWTGAPIKIFAGGRDDYDSRNPNACAEFVAQIPAPYQAKFTIQLYPEATHGWDQQNASFFDRNACAGRGCTNTNESNSEITNRSIKDLVDFFARTLSAAG